MLIPTVLRWLGATIADDVKIADIRSILHFPANLLTMEYDVTTFGRVTVAPFEMTRGDFCYIDEVKLGSGTNLGNCCTLLPGAELSPMSIAGSLMLVTGRTIHGDRKGIYLGIPARKMPFVVSENSTITHVPLSSNVSSIRSLLFACFVFFITNCILIAVYSSLPIFLIPFAHVIMYWTAYRYGISKDEKRMKFTFSEIVTYTLQFSQVLMSDFHRFTGPYLAGTQYLVFFLRILGTRIGCDVTLADINCVSDPHLLTISDHVRVNRDDSGKIMYTCHTFEQRLLKLAPVIVNHSSMLMSNALIFPGPILHGNNRILPGTLVMKNDQLPPNTNWSGVPT